MSLIQMKDLSHRYRKSTSLEHIDLSLEKNRIIGLLGPNGCGKTTLLKILTGLITDYKGSVSIAGQEPGVESKRMISYLPEHPHFDMSRKIRYYLRFYEDFYEDFDPQKAKSLLSSFSIDENVPLGSLSKGNQEKVHLALCMARNAQIYLLDEPIGGVDVASRDRILKTILENYNQDSLLIISSHIISEIEGLLDEVVFLKDGQVLFHKNAEDLREEHGKSVEDYFKEVY